MGFSRTVITVATMVVATGVDDLAGSQNRTAGGLGAVTLGVARGTGRQLFAHIVGQGQTATGASITAVATRGANAIAICVGGRGIVLEKVRMIFDLGRGIVGGSGGGFLVQFRLEGRLGVMRGSGDLFGGGIEFFGIALRTREGDDLRANNGGWTMHLTEMRQRKLYGHEKKKPTISGNMFGWLPREKHPGAHATQQPLIEHRKASTHYKIHGHGKQVTDSQDQTTILELCCDTCFSQPW